VGDVSWKHANNTQVETGKSSWSGQRKSQPEGRGYKRIEITISLPRFSAETSPSLSSWRNKIRDTAYMSEVFRNLEGLPAPYVSIWDGLWLLQNSFATVKQNVIIPSESCMLPQGIVGNARRSQSSRLPIFRRRRVLLEERPETSVDQRNSHQLERRTLEKYILKVWLC
jgi:hypothetical protein